MSDWVSVVFEEGGEAVEIPTEPTGNLLLSSLTAQFPGAIGIRYRNPQTNNLRGVRLVDNELLPPENEGWPADVTFMCVMPKKDTALQEAALKRKFDNGVGGGVSKNIRVENSESGGVCDLIVLGLAWKSTEQDIRTYFEQYGTLEMVLLKHRSSGVSKGFAFIRFADLAAQEKVLMMRHMIDGRWCDVRIPDSAESKIKNKETMNKIFVGRITEDLTHDDLKEHFDQFGSVSDIYIPKPFRAFAFVTFVERNVAEGLLGKDHTIKGTTVHIGSAQPKGSAAQMMQQGFGASDRMGRFIGGRGGFFGGGNGVGRGFDSFGGGFDSFGGGFDSFTPDLRNHEGFGSGGNASGRGYHGYGGGGFPYGLQQQQGHQQSWGLSNRGGGQTAHKSYY